MLISGETWKMFDGCAILLEYYVEDKYREVMKKLQVQNGTSHLPIWFV